MCFFYFSQIVETHKIQNRKSVHNLVNNKHSTLHASVHPSLVDRLHSAIKVVLSTQLKYITVKWELFPYCGWTCYKKKSYLQCSKKSTKSTKRSLKPPNHLDSYGFLQDSIGQKNHAESLDDLLGQVFSPTNHTSSFHWCSWHHLPAVHKTRKLAMYEFQGSSKWHNQWCSNLTNSNIKTDTVTEDSSGLRLSPPHPTCLHVAVASSPTKNQLLYNWPGLAASTYLMLWNLLKHWNGGQQQVLWSIQHHKSSLPGHSCNWWAVFVGETSGQRR